MNKNTLKITTILSTLMLLPTMAMAKPAVKDGDINKASVSNSNGQQGVVVYNEDSDRSVTKTHGVTDDDHQTDTTIAYGEYGEKSVTKEKDYSSTANSDGSTTINKETTLYRSQDGTENHNNIEKDVTYNSATGLSKTISGTRGRGAGETINKEGVTVSVDDRDITLTDKQAVAVKHERNAKVQNKKLIKKNMSDE